MAMSFYRLLFCTVNPRKILNWSSLNCQPGHGHTLHNNFRLAFHHTQTKVQSALCALVWFSLAGSVTPVPPTWCLTLPAWPLPASAHASIGSQGPSRLPAGNTVPQICISLCSSLHKNDASSERLSLISWQNSSHLSHLKNPLLFCHSSQYYLMVYTIYVSLLIMSKPHRGNDFVSFISIHWAKSALYIKGFKNVPEWMTIWNVIKEEREAVKC